MESLRYTGMFNPDEIWADDQSLYQKCVDQPYNNDYLLRAEDAKRQLALYKEFPQNQKHDRLIGHQIQIYQIKNPTWQTKGKILTPKGELELLLDIDLGLELTTEIGKTPYQEEIISSTKEYKLPDGTIIRGQHIRQIPLKESMWSKIEPYCVIRTIMITQAKIESYSFAIDTKKISQDPCLEFHITSYVKINEKTIQQTKEIARAAFKKNEIRDIVTPGKFDHMIYSKK